MKRKKAVALGERPLGITIIFIWLLIGLLSHVYALTLSFNAPDSFFGIFVNPPLSAILSIGLIIISAITLFALYKQRFWKLIIAVQLIQVINGVANVVLFFVTPFSLLATKLNYSIPAGTLAAAEALPNIFTIVKLLLFILMCLGLLIRLLILGYLFKSKQHFS